MRPFLPLFCLALASCGHSQPLKPAANSATKPAAKPPLRALIVSGGPRADYNQYAIESNARYLEKLTSGAISRRILFADGSKKSRTISALEARADAAERVVFSWIFETDDDSQRETQRASTLSQIDGPSTKKSIIENVAKLAGEAKIGERGLLYFTGHGSAGQKPRALPFGPRTQDDFENTVYSLWGDDAISARELASAVRDWPAQVPLVLVMVQCHAGGFANLIFEGGDAKNPLWNRDFCGFFAATGDRQASGCTSEVDETDYQDFTTHFFAALSGKSRDNRVITGADYDGNGTVSLLEAFAWTNLRDHSIDVPVCTSDAYLRSIYAQNSVEGWEKTPYSQLLSGAAPWQKALLGGLSQELKLSGEARIGAAIAAHDRVQNRGGDAAAPAPGGLDSGDISRRFTNLQRDLKARFPGLSSPRRSAGFAQAKIAALSYLRTRPNDVQSLSRAARLMVQAQESDATREAMLWRFVRTARTLVLQAQLAQTGTAEQKAVFARLRVSESRSPLAL